MFKDQTTRIWLAKQQAWHPWPLHGNVVVWRGGTGRESGEEWRRDVTQLHAASANVAVPRRRTEKWRKKNLINMRRRHQRHALSFLASFPALPPPSPLPLASFPATSIITFRKFSLREKGLCMIKQVRGGGGGCTDRAPLSLHWKGSLEDDKARPLKGRRGRGVGGVRRRRRREEVHV